MASNDILNYSKKEGIKMFDALSRTPSARQIKPLDQFDYIDYNHRKLYDNFNLMIGDVYIMVPPEFINIQSESFSQNVQILRQENTQKQKTGYHKRTILIDLVFNGMDEINGYKVPGPTHQDGYDDKGNPIYSNYYYVDGLRTLLAEFKLTPFLPITNSLINETYGIYTVALQSIVIRTIPGFQNALSAQLTLQEVNLMPYIEMPDMMFQYTIDWDLFRYYTQSILTENHEYKNLQSLPVNKDCRQFKISILKEEVLNVMDTGDKTKEATILDKVVNPKNYQLLIDSSESDVYISQFNFMYANSLTSIQMSENATPTLQYLGGLDTKFVITFETTDESVVQQLEQTQVLNDLMVRNNPKIRGSIGFVKLDSDLVTFCGSLYVMVESVDTSTVPGIPGLYEVKFLCTAYDIAQSRRENLEGFLPFANATQVHVDDIGKVGNHSGTTSNKWLRDQIADNPLSAGAAIGLAPLTGTALEVTGLVDTVTDAVASAQNEAELRTTLGENINQTIGQSYQGLMRKILQDNYAEWKLRKTMELYPDLRLPTYKEVNEAINNINAFRRANNKNTLPYSEYPVSPVQMSFGTRINKSGADLPNGYLDNGGDNVIKGKEIDTMKFTYNGYVDPDFYVFYPNTYLELYNKQKETENQKEQSTGKAPDNKYSSATDTTKPSKHTVTTKEYPDYGEETNASQIDRFITVAKQQIGCDYRFGAEGDIKNQNGPCFDSLGLLTYCLKRMGIIPSNNKKLTYHNLTTADIFQPISIKDIRRGDIITNSTGNFCVICTGYDENNNLSVIQVTSANGVSEASLFFTPAHAYRIIPLQDNSKMLGTAQSNPYISDGDKYPDVNGTIKHKKAALVDTIKGYTSSNPYGDDNASSRGYDNVNVVNTDTKATSGDLKKAYANEDLGIWSPMSVSELNAWINSHAPKGSPFRGHARIFIEAAKQSGLDPRYILAHAAVESAWGTSNIARKKNNYFGIGAFDSSPYKSAHTFNSGLAAGIIGGAKWISTNYYNGKHNQKTIQSMRFNHGVHQYATDPNWVNAITSIMKNMPKNASLKTIASESSNDGDNPINLVNKGQIDLNESSRKNQAKMAASLAKATAKPKLKQGNIDNLSIPDVADDGSKWTDGSVKITEYRTMSVDDFNGLARVVATECEGEKQDSMMAMAQLLYDRLTSPGKKWGGITNIVNNKQDFPNFSESVEKGTMNTAKACIQRVFQAGMRYRKKSTIYRFTSTYNGNMAVSNRVSKYDKIGSVQEHIYYGYAKIPSATIGYNIKGYGVSETSDNSVTVTRTYKIKTIDNVSHDDFGKPIYIRSEHFDTHGSGVGQEWKKDVNNDYNKIMTSFVDECQFSAKGKLLKAFPTFMLCILDDQAQWYDGRKLWTNFYIYKPVVDINYHAANDMPTSTATITVTNTYHYLDRNSSKLMSYSLSDDKSYTALNRSLYKNFGMVIGGLKLTNRLIQLHSIILTHTKLREGARIHLRMGYGSDPFSLAPIINGEVSGISLGDRIQIVVTSDGNEMIQNVVSTKKKDINNGAFGLFGLGSTQEPSNIIAGVMTKRESWMNHLFFGKNWFEGSKYNMEHYGLYLNSGQRDYQGGINAGTEEQWDLLMNIYYAAVKGNTEHVPYMYHSTGIWSYDHEANICFNKSNMTPWDVFQICAQTNPEFIVKPEKYQFDTRLFYGLPFELTKYRYDIINGTIYQECKANTQFHYVDSLFNIIENQVSVTSKRSYTNAKVMYTRGKTPKSTSIIHSDDTIDHSKQKTEVIDSPIVQDALGIDAVNEVFGYKIGKNAARKMGISDLLYKWEQQYQGQIQCLGMPQINPHDYIMVNDYYTSLNGLATVREVTHSFNSQTGFTTAIVPGVIGFCPQQDTGNITLIANFLKLYSSFTECSQNRKMIADNTQRFSTMLNSIKRMQDDFRICNFWQGAGNTLTTAANIVNLGENIYMATILYRTLQVAFKGATIIEGLKNGAKTLKIIYDAAKVTEGLFKSTRFTIRAISIMNGISKGVKVADIATKGIGAIGAGAAPFTFGISLLVTFIIDQLLNGLMEWFENKNVCVLLPMWWEGQPFVSGVKDGEKILLIKNTANATEENTGENGKETDEDEISVEGN